MSELGSRLEKVLQPDADTSMHWKSVEEELIAGNIEMSSYYLAKTNGGEWRDPDLLVLKGIQIQYYLRPGYVRGRPVWIAKITTPTK